jgi:hypothetical protein
VNYKRIQDYNNTVIFQNFHFGRIRSECREVEDLEGRFDNMEK